jgi:large subunit ribosomal protein LP2|eukprot:gene6997-biopygen3163
MRHLAAYLLLKVGGNENPTAEDIKALLGLVGVDGEEERLTQLLADLEGKDVAELIAAGQERLVKAGGAAVAAGAAGAAPAAAGGDAAPAKEEKPKVEEVDALDGGMDMFGGSGGGGDY